MKFLTNLIFEPQGKHDSLLAYNIKDTVMSADGSKVYFALQDVPAGIALSNTEYWQLQIDLSSSKSAMDEALASFGSYAKEIGTRVKGETAKASGNPVTCLADAGSLLQPVTVLEPKQEGSGDPSPSNLRPISGYDALGLSVAGKNLFDFKKPRSNTGSTTYEVDGDAIRIYTSAEGGTWRGVNYDYVTLKAGVKYTFSIDVITYTSGYMYYGPRRRSNNVFMTSCVATGTGHYTGTVTPSEDVEVYMALLVTNGTVTTGDITFANAQIAIGVETAYAPYHHKLHTVQIGQTVYGGKFDWLTGKLVAEYGFYTLTGTDSENWRELSSGGKYFMSVGVIGALHTNYTMYGVCSHAPSANGMIDRTRLMCALSSGSGLQVNTPSLWGVGTLAEWKDYLAAQYAAGTPVQVAYKLATPIEIQLTPHIISAADPEQTNTLYGDGRIDVEYVKPLHVSIEERVAAAVAAAMNTEGA